MLENDLGATFQGLVAEMASNVEEWSNLFTTDVPYSDDLPGAWEGRLTPFQRLLLVRTVREEKVLFAIRRYVGAAIGDYFTESPPFDLNGAYLDSVNVTPLIFILSPGADPTDYLLQVGQPPATHTYTHTYTYIHPHIFTFCTHNHTHTYTQTHTQSHTHPINAGLSYIPPNSPCHHPLLSPPP